MKNYIGVFLLFFFISGLFFTSFAQENKTSLRPDPKRFENDINTFKEWDSKNSFPRDAILFVGSSSIRMWPTAEYFPEWRVINRGFGGSTIGDVIFYYDDVVKKYNPKIIVFYAGDNDIAAGLAVDTVYNDYVAFCERVAGDMPATKIFYIPIKPSLNRWAMWDDMNKANQKIKTYCQENDNLGYIDTATPMLGDDGKPKPGLFLEDGLHLNKSGYDLWSGIVKPMLVEQ